MRHFKFFLGLVMGSLVGCASAPTVVPVGGADHATAGAGGAVLTVFPSSWEGDPDDLADYVTPVLVEIRNDGPQEVRVSYFDFALTDQSGFRYAALNPFVPASASLDEKSDPIDMAKLAASTHRERAKEESDVGVTLVAYRGGGGVRIGAPRAGGYAPRSGFGGRPLGVPPSAAPGWRGGTNLGGYGGGRYGGGYGGGRFYGGGGFGYGGPRWSGYAALPYYRPWFGVGVGYWNDPFLYPPGYATWVWGWSPTYYPSPRVPTDVVNAGLPEGVLQPGGHVSGFLYFQRSHANAQQLALTWNVTDARSNAPTGQARVLLEMRRN